MSQVEFLNEIMVERSCVKHRMPQSTKCDGSLSSRREERGHGSEVNPSDALCRLCGLGQPPTLEGPLCRSVEYLSSNRPIRGDGRRLREGLSVSPA